VRPRLPLLRATLVGGAIALVLLSTHATASARSQEATITLRCAGTELVATVTLPAGGEPVQFVELLGPLGTTRRIPGPALKLPPGANVPYPPGPPYEARWSSADYNMPATVFVEARIVAGPSLQQARTVLVPGVSRGRCPKRIAKQPPLVTRAADDATLGKATLGLGFGEVEELWGTPKQSACHGMSGRTASGQPWRGRLCYWGITLTGGGVSEGEISGVFELRPGNRQVLRAVTVHTYPGRSPRYRGWKTAGGIRLLSSVSELRRAYGGRLERVPLLNEKSPPVWYIAVTRGGTRIVTEFGTYSGDPDSVQLISLQTTAGFSETYRRLAKPSWRP